MPQEVLSYTVLVGSPSDVPQERDLVAKVVHAWNRANSDAQGVVLRSRRWEQDATPDLSEQAQAVINRQLVDDCDILVAFFWSRAGTPTATASSGTEEEIARCRAQGKRVLLYFASRAVPATADQQQVARVESLRKRFQAEGLCGDYTTIEELEGKLAHDLSLVVYELQHRQSPQRPAKGRLSGAGASLIAIGPDVVAKGAITGSSGWRWDVRLDDFVVGDIRTLTRYSESFSAINYLDRHILVESFGEGRVLTAPPSWVQNGPTCSASVHVRPPAARKRAQDLGTDLALGEDGDIFGRNGRMATVSGVEALPQKLRTCLSFRKGEWIEPDFGSRIAEYVATYRGSTWLDQLLTLEVIRLASIPYRDRTLKTASTPLQCVERVISFRLLQGSETGGWWRASIELEILGLGRWQNELKIFIGEYPPPPRPLPPSKIPGAMSLLGPQASRGTDTE